MAKTDGLDVVASLKAAIKANDEDRIFSAALSIGDAGRNDAVSSLLRLLSNDPRIRVKNGAAIALRELRANEAVPPLIGLIENKQFSTQRGTFIYALQTLDWYSKYSYAVARLLTDPNYEVRAMAYGALVQAEGSMSPTEKNAMFTALTLSLVAFLSRPAQKDTGITETVEAAIPLLVAKKTLRTAELVLA